MIKKNRLLSLSNCSGFSLESQQEIHTFSAHIKKHIYNGNQQITRTGILLYVSWLKLYGSNYSGNKPPETPTPPVVVGGVEPPGPGEVPE